MLYLALSKQLKPRHPANQIRWKHVLLIIFLSVSTLAMLIFSSSSRHDYFTGDKIYSEESNFPDQYYSMRRGAKTIRFKGSPNLYVETKVTDPDPDYEEVLKVEVDVAVETDKDGVHISRAKVNAEQTELHNYGAYLKWAPWKGVDSRTIRDPSTHFTFLHSPSNLCREEVELVIGVCSSLVKFDLREAIRKTWGSITEKSHLGVKIVFVLGTPGDDMRHLQAIIDEESQRYNDVIQEDIIDHYTNLSLKTMGWFSWLIQNCPKARFVMKTDDDVFLNVPNLLKELSDMRGPDVRFIMGHVIASAKPITDRNDKWYMPGGMYKNRTYPTYLSGTAYVMPGSLVHLLYENALDTRLFWLEDIYITGMLAKQVGVSLVHNPKFLYRKARLSPCMYRLLISGHDISHTQLYQIWKRLHSSHLDCSNTNLHFLGPDALQP